MQSLIWTGPCQFDMQTTSIPELRSGDVLLRVEYVGICGSELSGYLGTNSLRKPPLVMGHEFSGVVVSTSGDMGDIKVGDRVSANPIIECGRCDKCRRGLPQHCPHREFIGITAPGAYAEYVRVPARACVPVRDAKAGALVEPLACSVRAIRQSGLVFGDSVVVFGAGMIGLFAIKVAQLAGASHRILVDTNAHRLNLGKGFGATHVVNAKEDNPVQVIREITDGRVNKVIDAVGVPLVRQQSIELLDNAGTVVFIGLHHDETTIPGNHVVRSEIRIVGSFAYDHDDFARAHTLLESNVVSYDDSWLDIRPLGAAKGAFDEQIDGPALFPKIMLTPQ